MAAKAKKGNGAAPEEATEKKEFTHVFVNSPIDGKLYRDLVQAIRPEHKRRCGVLTLVTYGGAANDAYRIGRYLQMLFPDLFVHVPTVCASAGTLLVCAGTELIISPLSELGPLDAQILKSDELYARRSGLVVRSIFENLGQHAFDLYADLVENIIDHSSGMIKYRTAAQIAGEMSVGLLDGLYEQINPEQIGEDYRYLKVAEEYGKRLADRGQNISEEGVNKLVYDFPAHDFIIDFREAVELFSRVNVPSAELINDYDGTNTPLSALSSKDRIIRVTTVQGYPARINGNDEGRKHVKPSTESGGSGRASPEGDAEPAPTP